MKKILAFLALASLAQVTFAQTAGTHDAAALTFASGSVFSNPTPANGTAAANTCSVLSTVEPNVTINLSRDVVAALRCNTGANAVGAATQHPAGRPACIASQRCAYVATTAGGPVTPVQGGTTPPTMTAPQNLITCAGYISGLTSGQPTATCN